MNPPAEIEKVAELLKAGRRDARARGLQATGAAGQRVHALLVDESSAVVDYEKKDPIIATGPHEVTVLDCRPIPIAEGSLISIEARLSIGQTSEPWARSRPRSGRSPTAKAR